MLPAARTPCCFRKKRGCWVKGQLDQNQDQKLERYNFSFKPKLSLLLENVIPKPVCWQTFQCLNFSRYPQIGRGYQHKPQAKCTDIIVLQTPTAIVTLKKRLNNEMGQFRKMFISVALLTFLQAPNSRHFALLWWKCDFFPSQMAVYSI